MIPAKAFGGKLEEFWICLDIPVSVTDINMAEVGCELWQFPSDIEACTIPVDEPAGRESVTKVLEPRSTTDAPVSRWHAQADGTGYPGERTTSGTALQPSATLGNEKRLCAGSRTELIALRCVVCKRRAG